MTVKIKSRVKARGLTFGLVLGATVGVGLGACYVAGGIARADDSQTRTVRLARAAAGGFSDSALRAEVASMEPGALALAQQHDPVSLFAAGLRLDPESADPAPSAVDHLGLASAPSLTGPAARPFHFAELGALQSTRDLECLTDAVYYESRGETSAGQAAVAQVVLNRVRHPAFPKTVCGVVFQGASDGDGCQFSFACDGSMRRTRDDVAWRRAEQVAARALDGSVMPAVGNATHFHVIGLDPGWGPSLLRVAQIGLHVFYRFGGYAGAPSTFNGVARPSAPDSPPPAALEQASADGNHAGAQIILASTAPVVSAPSQPAASVPAAPAAAGAKPVDAPAVAAPAKDETGAAPAKASAGA